jgi:hypothetical protein
MLIRQIVEAEARGPDLPHRVFDVAQMSRGGLDRVVRSMRRRY